MVRSLIGMEYDDGVIKAIYCHWNGSPDNNGRILKKYYNTPEKIEELLSLGDISSLGKNIGVAHDIDDYEFFMKNDQVCAYGRDGGVANNEATIYDSFEEFIETKLVGLNMIRYFYLFNLDDQWEIWNDEGVQLE